ncbi:MAG TPA: plastocyanin/azurin family copper-binding protein [Solirubrobacterales bacterium]
MHLVLASVLGGALLSIGVVSGLAADRTVEAAGSAGSYHWQPSTAEISPNGTVEFKNTEAIPHAVTWTGGPETPSCPGVPSAGEANWNGTCTFVQSGTYTFHCTVHPTEMTGTITVTGPTKPTVTTEAANPVGETEATLNGKVNPKEQSTTFWFNWGTTAAYGEETTHESAGSGNTTLTKSAAITGLTAATTYHFQIVATNASGESKGGDKTFTTAGPPTATTEPATGIGSTEATLKGMVNPKGLETKYFFNYGTTEAYGEKTSETVAGSGTSSVTASKLVSGLAPETTYHFQLVAKNSANGGSETKGLDKTFTTHALGSPSATTGAATEVGETSAKLGGAVNPEGLQTKYFFNYGTTSAYGQKTEEKIAGSGTASVDVSEQLTGLSPGTTYHFQLVAKNSGGEVKGEDQAFTTASTPPPPPPPPPTPTPIPTPTPTPQPRPDTKITLKPPAKTHDRTPTIKFRATAAGASYQCSVDAKPFRACHSPFTAPSLKPGRHRIRVRSLIAGVADPTPASVSFKVVGAR